MTAPADWPECVTLAELARTGMTRARLAADLGITRQALRRFASGERPMPWTLRDKLARVRAVVYDPATGRSTWQFDRRP